MAVKEMEVKQSEVFASRNKAVLKTPDGQQFQLTYNPHTHKVTLYVSNRVGINPVSANCVELADIEPMGDLF